MYKRQLGDNKNTRLILLTDEYYPRLEVIFGGHDSFREAMVIDAEEFIAVKGFKAKGKRITTYTVDTINAVSYTHLVMNIRLQTLKGKQSRI